MDLQGKVVWVVGASSGIGAATADELVRRGAIVAVSARRAKELESISGGRMLEIPADVTDLPSLQRAAEHIRNTLGPIDIAVISAGYWKRMPGDKWNTKTFNEHIQVNIIGTSNVIAVVLPEMLERGFGLIAGISSVAGYRGLPGSEAYGATKAAQINLLEALRVSVAPSNVKVTTVCPGFVRTDLTSENTFPMPFIIDADRAGREICNGIEKDRALIVFPKRMAFVMKLAQFVPTGLWVSLLTRNKGQRKRNKNENS